MNNEAAFASGTSCDIRRTDAGGGERPRRSRGAVGLALALELLASGHAADKATAPTLEHLFPVAAISGSTTTVTAVGKFTPWPPQVWTDAPGISFHAGEKPGQFNIEVGPDVPLGPHLVRLFNETGASAPRFLIVAAGPEQTETEPNDEFAKAPTVGLPATINGRLNKNGDVDCHALRLESGQVLVATLDAYVLGSPVDAVFRLLDTRGRELAINHDNGRNPDPALTWTAPTAGTYILQVFGFAHPATSEVRFTGSDACVYRLHLATDTGAETPPESEDRKLRESGNRRPEAGNPAAEDVRTTRLRHSDTGDFGSKASGGFPALVSSERVGPEWREQDYPAGTATQPAPTAPFAVIGCIEQIGEQDRFGFSARKDEKLVLSVESAALGFPLDAWLAVQNSDGKELARSDDGTNADPLLEWTVPETGSFVVVVGNVLHRAGPDHRYRLRVQPAKPQFQGVIAEAGFTVESGKSVKLKVTARRVQGFKKPLTASVTGLPEGLTAKPVELRETDKEITLEISASADALPFSGPFQVVLRDPAADTVHYGVHELVSTTLRNGVPQGFRDLVIPSTNQLWLTVRSIPSAEPAAEK